MRVQRRLPATANRASRAGAHSAAAEHVNRAPMLAQHADPSARASNMIHLQRTLGNSHVQRMLNESPHPPAQPVAVQRSGCGAATTATRAPANDAILLPDAFGLATAIQRSTGGEPLHKAARSRLEPAMGLDLGHVKIHRDAEADGLARAVSADAFTSGDHIFFRRGAYDPESRGGLHLLAHEISHTEQQARGPVGRTTAIQAFGGLQISEPGDAHEVDAERKADAVIARLTNLGAGRAGRVAGMPPLLPGRTGPADGQRRPVASARRESRSAGDLAIIQRSVQQDVAPGFTAKWSPFANVQGPPFNQTSKFDTDGFHEEFNIPPKSSGRLILLADVEWTHSGGGNGPTQVLPKPGPSEACRILQAITKPIPVLNQVITFACNTKDPGAVIDSLNDAQLCALAALIGLGVGGILCGGFVLFGAAEAIRNLLKDALGIPRGKTDPKPPPGPTPVPTGSETGKGRATIETRYFVGVDGKIQMVGLPPRIEANGTGAELVSPVEFIRTEIPDGVNIAFQPMIKGTTSGETHVFQHQWGVDLKKPAPPPPLPFAFGIRLFPFVTGKERFEDEGSTQGRLLNWFQTMDPRVLSRITGRQIPVGIAGHASHLGDAAFNLALSERRARRVALMVTDFGGSFAGVATFAFGELLAGGGPSDNAGAFRRADVAVCGQLQGADAAAGPLVPPSGNDPTICPEVAPKLPALSAADSTPIAQLPPPV